MIILDYLRKSLSNRLSESDFSSYFTFLESLCTADTGEFHHILPKNEFPQYRNDPNNRICLAPANHFKAHYFLSSCAPKYVPFQRVLFMMSNFSRKVWVSHLTEQELENYSLMYEHGRKRQIEHARLLGKAAVESGLLARLRTHEHQVKAGIAAGKDHVRSGRARKNGKKSGQKAVQNGQLSSLRTTEHQRYAASKSGKLASATGQIQKLAHLRWHVNRNLTSPICPFCTGG